MPLQILALGDSLTAGYGLALPNDAFPAQLERALVGRGHAVKVLPAGISGDTTTGGLNRLEWALAAKPDAVIVELGANDALRGIDPKLTGDNLRAIVRRIQRDGTPVLLAGMLAPPNFGRDFGDRFNAIYPAVAKESGALLYPFFLDGVAANPKLNQADQMHPTPAGVAIIVERMLPSVEKLITQAEKASSKITATMMRLFVGIGVPEGLAHRLSISQAGQPGARWVAPESMHMTLKFIGEIERNDAEDIDEMLASIAAPGFDLDLRGVGTFGQGLKAKALWVGIDASEPLNFLQAKVESAVVRAGQPQEGRKFTPHISLAHFNRADPNRLQNFIEGNSLFRAGPWTVDHFTLFESRMGKGGSVYVPLADYELGPQR